MKKFLFGLSLAIAIFSTQAAEPNFPNIVITGYGQVHAIPDMATFSARIEETMPTAEEAKTAVDNGVTSFVNRLLDTGLLRKDISSAQLGLSPQFDYSKSSKKRLTGYKASRQIQVTVHDLSKLDNYLDGALKDGINRIDSINLDVADKEKYQDQARLKAVQDAKQKALSLAEGVEKQLGNVWHISYDTAQPIRPVLLGTPRMALASASKASTYQDTSILIHDQVRITYRLK